MNEPRAEAIGQYQHMIREHRHALIYAPTPVTAADIQLFSRRMIAAEEALALLGRALMAETTDPEPQR